MYESTKLVQVCWWRHVAASRASAGTTGIGTATIGMLAPTTKELDINNIFHIKLTKQEVFIDKKFSTLNSCK